jgi:hypothetical protein
VDGAVRARQSRAADRDGWSGWPIGDGVHLLSLGEWQALDIWTRPTAAGAAEQHRGRVISKGDSPMPDWYTPLIVILALLALALFVAYWNSRKTKYLAGVVALMVLIAGAWLIAHFLPTDRKAIEAVIDDMAAGVRTKNSDQVFRHFAKDFRFRSMNKKEFESRAEPVIRSGPVRDILILDYDKVEISRSAKKADLVFRFRPDISGEDRQMPYQCEAVFVLEDDGQWRMQTFEVYFLIGNRQQVPIPGI